MGDSEAAVGLDGLKDLDVDSGGGGGGGNTKSKKYRQVRGEREVSALCNIHCFHHESLSVPSAAGAPLSWR